MFNKRFSFGRAALLAALVLFLSVGFTSCQREAEYPGYVKVGDVKAYDLKADDPICGAFTGNMGDAFFYPNIAFATAASATNLTDVEGKKEGSYFTFEVFDWSESDYVEKYFDKDSYKVYVVYNKFTDSDELDKHSGVVIFRTKYSPYGTPRVDSYYGVKFQFLVEGDVVPETRTAETQYTDNLFIAGAANSDDQIFEGWTVTGYKSEDGYNTISSLEEAVTKLAFDNTDVFGTTYWNWGGSGASKVTE